MINFVPIGKAIWEFSKPAVKVAGQVVIGIGTAMVFSQAIDGVSNGIKRLLGKKQPAAKTSNSKKASGNRKAKAKVTTDAKKTVRKSTKSTTLGEKSTGLSS